MNPRVHDFADLVRWLADTRHGGSVNQIAKRLQVAPATVDKWVHRVTHAPTLPFVYMLCDAYKLDIRDVLPLLAPRRRRRGAAVVVLALSLLGWASADAQPLPLDGPLQHNPDSIGNILQNQQVRMRLIGMARRILWWFGCDWGTIAPAY